MRLRILPVILGTLLFIGVGCSSPPDENDPQINEGGNTTSTPGGVNGEKIEENIELTGSVTGSNSVQLEWNPSDETRDIAEKWMVVEGTDTDPAYPENYRYYFLTDVSHHERDWKNLPTGISHFRVCAWIDNACAVYSNNVALEIPGRMQNGK